MKAGRAFEIFVKRLLINIGFSEVPSDGLYVYDGPPGQMIQGLGEAHNADVLLEPPAQTPFFIPTRLLIECKEYKKKVGLDIVRSALGLREDINHFDIVDLNELKQRRSQRRKGILYNYKRYLYQVGVISVNGYTAQAQKFAATHRIPLLEFNKMPYWTDLNTLLERILDSDMDDNAISEKICEFADSLGRRMAVAITNFGQILFLYREFKNQDSDIWFSEEYSLYWLNEDLPWKMVSGGCQYHFQLPDSILKQWIGDAFNGADKKRRAIDCKLTQMSSMIVYYVNNGHPEVKMISIDKGRLEEIMRHLGLGE